MNTYSRDYTSNQSFNIGEKSPHNWLTTKRIKQLGVYWESIRNVHPLSIPVSDEIKREMAEKLK